MNVWTRRAPGFVLAGSLLAVAGPAAAQVAQLDAWTLASSSNPGANFNVNAGNITVSAGSGRLLVVAAVIESSGSNGTISNFNATVGGIQPTAAVGTEATAAGEAVKVWYFLDASIPAGPSALTVSGNHSQNPAGLHIYWASFSGVDQTSPVVSAAGNYAAAAAVSFGSAVNFLANGSTFYVTGNGGTPATHAPVATFAQQATATSNNHSSFVEGTAVHATAGTYAAGTSVAFGGTTAGRSAVVAVSLRPAPLTADLAITKTAAATAVVGDNITYTLTVTNNGPDNAPNVTVTDALPVELIFVSATPSQGSCSGATTVTCNLGTIANGGSATIGLVATAAYPGVLANTASVTSSASDPNAADNGATASVDVAQITTADVSVTKSASASALNVGATVTFTLTVANTSGAGTGTANGVTLTDPLPAGMTWVGTTVVSGTASCSGTSTVTCTVGPGGNLPFGASATIQIQATASLAGAQINTAHAAVSTSSTYDPDPTNDSAAATVVVTAPGAQPLVCAGTPPVLVDGGTLSGVINTYFPGTASVAAGSTTLQLGAASTAGAPTPIASGDYLLVIQMQDATIDCSNTANYGGGTGSGAGALAGTINAGKYEFVRATSAVGLGGGSLNVAGGGAGSGLVNSYTNANAIACGAVTANQGHGQQRFQVVRVPQFLSATLNGISAAPWTTTTAGTIGLGTGGIVAVDIQGNLTLTGIATGAINADGRGFRGALGRQLGGQTNPCGGLNLANTDWLTPSTCTTNGGKGEGNAGTPLFLYNPPAPYGTGSITGACPTPTNNYAINTNQPNDGYPGGSMARGAPGSAGGGSTDDHPSGNDFNSGGGGGSNGGKGGTGGFSWNTVLDRGGRGAGVTPGITQLVLGGGGGAGTRNNDACGDGLDFFGRAASGTSGGGLVVARAGSLTVNPGASLSSRGLDAYNDSLNDGGGGGGAGGSIILTIGGGTFSGLTVRADGGRGGSAWRLQAPGTAGEFTTGAANNRHGPGGGGGGGVIVYSVTATPPALSVAGGPNGTSTTANQAFGAQAGDPGQTLTAAPGQIPGLGSAADCSVDPTISLQHTPATQATGSSVTFVASVTNLAPFVATSGSVTVQISVDAGLSVAAGAFGVNGWSCSTPGGAGAIVTCTRSDALAAGQSWSGSGPTGAITFSAMVIASGPATLSNNVATVSNGGDSNLANNTATDVVGVRAPTFARLRSFHATRAGGLVVLRWQTSFEAQNLGFRIHREAAGERRLVTPSLIAGSALFVGRQQLSSGRSYAWVDRDPGADPVYWLEDVDVSGAQGWTGPVTPVEEQSWAGAEPATSSPLLASLGRAGAPQGPRSAAPGLGLERRVAPSPGGMQDWTLPSRPAAKLLVRQEGFYRLTKADLLAAGYDPGTDPGALRLLVGGQRQGLFVDDGGDGSFDPADFVEFYGLALDSPFDPDHVYWLVAERGPANALRLQSQAPRDDLAATLVSPSSFPFTLERRDRTVYFAALTNNGDTENFFGAVITSEPAPLELTLSNLDPTAPAEAWLTLALQGATPDLGHRVAVQLNGQDLGQVEFTGQEHTAQKLAVPASLLREGSNELVLTALAGADDVSVVDYVRLTYQHLYRLDAGALRLPAPGGSVVTIEGLAQPNLRVVDVSDPTHLQELAVQFAGQPGELSATVAVPAGPTRTLFAFTPERVLAPAGVVLNTPSELRLANNAADLVIVAHASLRAALQPLQALRASQGLTTVVLDAADVYDEFGYGQKTPYAIRDLLQQAATVWQGRPRFVLLAGDASFDPKNYLGLGDYDLLPTKLIPTAFLKTDSDDWFADLDQDGLPDLAIGRLPARSAQEAALLVAKLQVQAASLSPPPTDPAEGWRQHVLLVSDRKAEFNFDATAAALASLVPPELTLQRVAVTELGSAARAELLEALASGQLLVDYVGHGSEDLWSREAILTSVDASALTNGPRLPFVVDMTCLNGLFADLFVESLAEAFLKAPGGGAVAVWASSGLSEPGPQALMNQELLRQLFQAGPITIGEAVARAKAVVSDQDVRRTWILFGDPSMRLR